jgi:hypothetical protein
MSTETMTYMICDGQGDQLCDGLSEENWLEVAKATAARLGITVYVSNSDGEDVDHVTPEEGCA